MPAESQKRSSSNLYLVTFLATLFLLLFVSCAIVLRSYLLRRQYRRQVEHALAHGFVLTPRGARKKRFGVRPHMYESWIAPLHVSGVSASQLDKAPGGRWADMLPLTVQTVIVKRRTRGSDGATASPALSSPSTIHHPLLSFSPPNRNTARFSAMNLESVDLNSVPISARVAQPGTLVFPNTRVDEQELLPNLTRERNRERRESTNWRTIVSPSPSLASAGTSVPTRRLSTPATSAQRPVPPEMATSLSPTRPRPTSAVMPSTSGSRWNSFLSGWGRPELNTLSPAERDAHFEEALTHAWVIAPNTATNNQPPPATVPDGTAAPATAKCRVRTEMMQISVLVAMPDIRMSTMYGDAGVVKRLKAAEVGGWGYRGPAVKDAEGKSSLIDGDSEKAKEKAERKRRKKEEEKARKENEDEDEDEIVEVPGDESSASSSEDEDEEDEEHVPLPELVLGVTRLNYRHGQFNATAPEERPPPTFIIPTSPPPPPPPAPEPIPVPLAVYDTPEVPAGQHLFSQPLVFPRPEQAGYDVGAPRNSWAQEQPSLPSSFLPASQTISATNTSFDHSPRRLSS